MLRAPRASACARASRNCDVVAMSTRMFAISRTGANMRPTCCKPLIRPIIGAVQKAKRIIFLLAIALLASAAAVAQESYPNRSVRLVIDTSPGGVTDLFGRLAAEALTPRLGQTVYVDNKPGASGNVAIDYVVRSAPDGYTLMIASGGGLVVKPFLERGLTFDVMNDLVPICNVAEVAHILVVPASVPARDIAEFI